MGDERARTWVEAMVCMWEGDQMALGRSYGEGDSDFFIGFVDRCDIIAEESLHFPRYTFVLRLCKRSFDNVNVRCRGFPLNHSKLLSCAIIAIKDCYFFFSCRMLGISSFCPIGYIISRPVPWMLLLCDRARGLEECLMIVTYASVHEDRRQ